MKLIPTQEQQSIIELSRTGKNISINAFAGCAKSSTLKMIIEDKPINTLYVLFNKANVEEFKQNNIPHCLASTWHSLAYRDIIKYPKSKMGQKLSSFLDMNDIEKISNNEDHDFILKLKIIELIKLFCQSAEEDSDEFLAEIGQSILVLDEISYKLPEHFDKYWFKLINENSKAKITHDIYLKLYQLRRPKLIEYSRICLDEGQDTSPVCLDIFLNQDHAQKIIVGDKYQSIYEWRGAVNAMELVDETFVKMYLTESFRFTQEIADQATKLINIIGNDKRIIGKNNKNTESFTSKAILVRNNTTLLNELIKAYENNLKVCLIGDLNDIWKKMFHIESLYCDKFVKYPDDELRMFKDFDSFYKAAKGSKIKNIDPDPNMNKLYNIFMLLKGAFDTIYQAKIKLTEIIVKEKDADVVLCTGHKSKGLEWQEVTLSEDFFKLTSNDLRDIYQNVKLNQTLELLYVALTRGKYKINLPTSINILLDKFEELNKVHKVYNEISDSRINGFGNKLFMDMWAKKLSEDYGIWCGESAKIEL